MQFAWLVVTIALIGANAPFDDELFAAGARISVDSLSKEDRETLDRALRPDASADDKAKAKDICKEKCKICFDGQNCDLQCAKDKCGKTSTPPATP